MLLGLVRSSGFRRVVWVLVIALSLGGSALAQDFDAVEALLTGSVKKGQISLRQASAMMRALREFSLKEEESARKKPKLPAKTTERDAWRRARYGKFDLGQENNLEFLIGAALNQPVEFVFTDTPLEEVLEVISVRYGLPIAFHASAHQDKEKDRRKVSINVKAISLRSGLRLLLHEFGLTYRIETETLWVLSEAESARRFAKEHAKLSERLPPLEGFGLQVQPPEKTGR